MLTLCHELLQCVLTKGWNCPLVDTLWSFMLTNLSSEMKSHYRCKTPYHHTAAISTPKVHNSTPNVMMHVTWKRFDKNTPNINHYLTRLLHYLGTHNLALVIGCAHVSLFLGHFFNCGSLHVIEGLTDVRRLHVASHPPSPNTINEGFKHTCSVYRCSCIKWAEKRNAERNMHLQEQSAHLKWDSLKCRNG